MAVIETWLQCDEPEPEETKAPERTEVRDNV